MTPKDLQDYIKICEDKFGIKVVNHGRWFQDWEVTYKGEMAYRTSDPYKLKIFLHGMFTAHQIKG